MKNAALYVLFFLSLLLTVAIFLFSCVATISDAQGVVIFIFTLPAMGALLLAARFLGHALDKTKVPTFFAAAIVGFFIISLVPGLNRVSMAFLGMVGNTFEFATGKTPRAYFHDRKSFPVLLKKDLEAAKDGQINFDVFGVTFAWDKVCIFGPYTNNDQAQKVLNMDWKIEERSKIAQSDSIHALVFLYQGHVNTVIDLSRGIADFKNVGRCFDRSEAHFTFERDPSGRVVILLPE